MIDFFIVVGSSAAFALIAMMFGAAPLQAFSIGCGALVFFCTLRIVIANGVKDGRQ
jgi:hypothetical protein